MATTTSPPPSAPVSPAPTTTISTSSAGRALIAPPPPPRRVAVVSYGLSRSSQWCAPTLQACIVAPLRAAGATVDLYVHALELRRPLVNARAGEHGVTLAAGTHALLGPAAWTRVEDQEAVDARLGLAQYHAQPDPWAANYACVDNLVRGLYSLDQATVAWQQSGVTYDAVIITRPDVAFVTPLQVAWLAGLPPSGVLLPNFHCYGSPTPVNDRWAAGRPAQMAALGRRFTLALEYSRGAALHSETFLSHLLQGCGITAVPVPMLFLRVRGDGAIEPRDVRMLARAGVALPALPNQLAGGAPAAPAAPAATAADMAAATASANSSVRGGGGGGGSGGPSVNGGMTSSGGEGPAAAPSRVAAAVAAPTTGVSAMRRRFAPEADAAAAAADGPAPPAAAVATPRNCGAGVP